jgi:putative cell wall-binding protein
VTNAVITQLGSYAPKVTVLAGDDRYATSAEVAKWGYPSGTERAFLATGTDFPDALAGSAIAGAIDGPILLVKQATVPGSVEAELQRLGVSEISLLGGPAAISYTVQDAVDDL